MWSTLNDTAVTESKLVIMQFGFPLPCMTKVVVSTALLNVMLTVVVLADTFVARFAGTVDTTVSPADVPCVCCALERPTTRRQRMAIVTLFMWVIL